ADMHKTYGLFRFSPRPAHGRVRKYSFTNSMSYVENGQSRLDTRDFDSSFSVEFQNSDMLNFAYGDSYEYLPAPFTIAPGVTGPVGGYRYDDVKAGYNFGAHRRVSGNASVTSGTFYNGRRTTLGVSSGRVELTPRFSLQPTLSVNWVDLVQGSFTTTLT